MIEPMQLSWFKNKNPPYFNLYFMRGNSEKLRAFCLTYETLKHVPSKTVNIKYFRKQNDWTSEIFIDNSQEISLYSNIREVSHWNGVLSWRWVYKMRPPRSPSPYSIPITNSRLGLCLTLYYFNIAIMNHSALNGWRIQQSYQRIQSYFRDAWS